MLIRPAAHFVMSQTIQRQVIGEPKGIKGLGMQIVHLPFNVLQRNTPNPADRMREIFVDHFLVDSNSFKDLGALIGLDGADPHLGGNLYNAVKNGIVVILHRRIVILIQHMGVDQLLDGFLGQIGIDGTGPVA